MAKRISYLVLSIKPHGESIELTDESGKCIASIVARPVQGRVKVGISAGKEITISRSFNYGRKKEDLTSWQR